MGRMAWVCGGLALAVLLQACGGCETSGPASSSSGLPGVGTSSGGGTGSSSSGGQDPVESVRIDPATLSIATQWGAPAVRQLRLLGRRHSGVEEEVVGIWSVDNLLVARVNSQGLLTATAQRAGAATITAEHKGITATATATITLNAQRVLPGAPTTAPVDFSTATCSPTGNAVPSLLYPLDQVVLPLNLPSPAIQWQPGPADIAVQRLTLSGAAATVVLYLPGAATQVSIPQDLWSVLLQAHAGGQITWSLDALVDQNQCGTSARRTLHLATADLSATVYYWAVNVGQIVRLDVGATAGSRVDIQPANSEGSRCNACHVLSRDGQKLAFTYYGGNGPGGVVSTADPRNPIVAPDTSRTWNYATFSADGSLLLTNLGRRFTLRNANDGTTVRDLPLTDVAMPTWSPDGSRVAFAGDIAIGGGAASWEIDFETSNLKTMGWNASTQDFGPPTVLVSGGGKALSYPSFSPDGRQLIYQRGPWSRSARENIGAVDGDLDLVDLAGGTPVTLAAANPNHNSYMPTFSPFEEGGFLWVAFFSRRNYGHHITDGRPQIWVAALDRTTTAGVDPSHPPFWLGGQDEATSNLSSYFSPSPCRDAGGECTTDVQCCSGQLCRPTSDGALQCQDPELACSLAGESCLEDADCCAGAGTCHGRAEGGEGFCSTGGNACRLTNETCTADGDCCPGAGTCRTDPGGVLLCTLGSPGECRKLNESCTQDADCCTGAGLCLGGFCGVPGG